jgi:hypothetical protein
MTQTQTTHTRGPYYTRECREFNNPSSRVGVYGPDGELLVHFEPPHYILNWVPDLLNGAYQKGRASVYDKHFGALAVEAAEADLLGEALDLIRQLLGEYGMQTLTNARALLSKLTP